MRKHLPVLLMIGALALLFLFAAECYLFFRTPLISKNVTAVLKVYPNEGMRAVITRLKAQRIIYHPVFFQWIFSLTGDHLHFGEYQIQFPLSAWGLMKNMRAGTGLVTHKFTIVEGWTIADIRAAFAKDAALQEGAQLVKMRASTAATVSKIILPADCSAITRQCEGRLYPSTYFFLWGNTDQTIIKSAYDKMQGILQTAWIARAPNLPYQNPYQALIVASLIERETAMNSEKSVIASVIENRLKKNMPLQIDPTVLYGLQKNYGASITKADLRQKTPYNTYTIKGLPPTPICMPDEASIQAALHPSNTNYLYYVANRTGGHIFSENYAAHKRAIASFISN